MGMGIGINVHAPDEGVVKGRQEEVACGVWFTSTGVAMPKMIKYKDREGVIHTLSGIHVKSSRQKNYCGIPVWEYECDAVISGRCHTFFLLYYMERQKWQILWKNQKVYR